LRESVPRQSEPQRTAWRGVYPCRPSQASFLGEDTPEKVLPRHVKYTDLWKFLHTCQQQRAILDALLKNINTLLYCKLQSINPFIDQKKLIGMDFSH